MTSFTSQFTKLSFPDLGLVRFPDVAISAEDKALVGLKPKASNVDFLKHLTWAGLEQRRAKGQLEGYTDDQLVEQLKMEFATFAKTGVHDYLLMVWDINRWADQQSIVRGWGRGSAASSLTLFALGITHVNPLRHKLNFPRFLSEARMKPVVKDGVIYVDGKSAPDIDCDYQYGRRAEVVRYMEGKYAGRTCKISTRMELTGKMALKDAVKTYQGYSEEEAKHVSDMIEARFGKVQGLAEAQEKNEEVKKWLEASPANREAYTIAMAIEGLAVGKGQHPSGVFVSYHPLDGNVPTELSKTGDVVTSNDMETVAGLGIKADILGVRTLDLVANTAALVGIPLETISVDDPIIYEYLNRAQNAYMGLFQIEEGTTKEAVVKVGPRDIDALSACLAISRPGALKYLDQYAAYERTGALKTIYPLIDEVLKDTGNVLVFQEQITEICREVYKLSGIDADQVRYCVAGDTMLVSKTRGWVSMTRLMREGYKGDLFLTLDEKGVQSWGEIDEMWSNGKRTVRHITAQNGLKVRATTHHQFLTHEGWKTVHWLDKDKDWLVGVRGVDYDGVDGIPLSLALVIAGVLAEGHFPCGKTGATFVAHDPEMMRVFQQACRQVYGHDVYLSPDGKVVTLKKAERAIIEQYAQCGLSKHKVLPDVMMGMTKETTRQFLSFLLACEGGVTFQSRQFEFSSKSEELIRQVQLLLLRFGIHSNLMEKTVKGYEDEGPYYRLYIAGYLYQRKLREELTCLWPSTKLAQLDAILTEDRREASEGDLVPLDITRRFMWQHSHLFTTRKEGLSGQFYSQNLSRPLFTSMVEKSEDPEWIAFCAGSQRYLRIDALDYRQKEVEVFDFRMKDASRPHVVANGLVIHNCVGKKKKDEMAKWETVLREQGNKQAITDSVTKYFWDVCNASADYLFVKSHAVSYGYLTAVTAYLKAKYPSAFYLSMLRLAREEPNALEYMNLIMAEMRAFTPIKILPPDIIRSQTDFSLEKDPDTGLDHIRFGLSSIKGISDTTMEKLGAFRNRSSFNSKVEIFEAAKAAGINISTLAALILSGCLSWPNTSRTKLVLEAQTYNLLSDTQKTKVKQFIEEGNQDIIETLRLLASKTNEKGKPLIPTSQMDTLRRKYKPYWDLYQSNSRNEELAAYMHERHYLGFSYSSALWKVYSKRMVGIIDLGELAKRGKAYGEANAKRAKEEKVYGDPLSFVAFVDEVKSCISQKSGKPYIKLLLSDDSGSIRGMLFDEERIESCKRANEGALPKAGDVVSCEGSFAREGQLFFVDTCIIQPNPIQLKRSSSDVLEI